MKKIFVLAMLALNAGLAMAQDESAKKDSIEGFEFTTIKELPITSIKNQAQSGTCWCFSSLSFFESELLRMGKGEHDLCEMFVVHHTMIDRGVQAVRTHGDVSFAQGGSFYDVAYCIKNYGICPQDAMPEPGKPYGSATINHNELDQIATAYVNAIAKGKQKKISPLWKNCLTSIYDQYLGALPEKFTANGVEYTPKSYAASLGLNMDDYVSLTSYTHHPFYESFAIEVQDNWRWAHSYNLPLDEFMRVFDNAIDNGYPIAWGSDVSEEGFNRWNNVSVVPETETSEDLTGSDQARWLGLTPQQRKGEALKRPAPEKVITQEMRQEAYDNWETTDDHGMLIYGKAKDQTGKEYFMVKNSWGDYGKYHGMFYASKAFVAYKTMNILVHKDALPKDIKKKLGLK
ncbi:MAG: aminopeptidase [Bacteroidaceae bacterium]|nr:aminopeptidase [Bacteroidaceae bacterium]